MPPDLTPEQLKIIHHPIGVHARVLAVAGSGKTTTLVHRIQYLIEKKNIDPNKICILMFNTRAREDFQRKVERLLLHNSRPAVHNFHSYSYSVIRKAVETGIFPESTDNWELDAGELSRIYIKKAISNLEREHKIPLYTIDPDEALNCIGLWKGSLISPECAGHRSNPDFAIVYHEFERLRLIEKAISFDDFVPIAVQLIENYDNQLRIQNEYDFIMVDEYQDVNYGQQKLIELLAGKKADILLVGDDDQTIYEWRGARPEYIHSKFSEIFNYKNFETYTLSLSFRFGPIIAQCAENLILHNKKRVEKKIIAYHYEMWSDIHLIEDSSEQVFDSNLRMAEQLKTIVRETKDPQSVIVLGRTFSQLVNIEMAFLKEKIPYRVIGRGPFFERREISALIDYLVISMLIKSSIDDELEKRINSIINIPNRKVNKSIFRRTLESIKSESKTTEYFFNFLLDSSSSPFQSWQRPPIEELFSNLSRINEILLTNPLVSTATLLKNIITWTSYCKHFDDFYGRGENSEDRKNSVRSIVAIAKEANLPLVEFLNYVQSFDSTLGVPLEEQIVLTTVYRVKGEEFDYVFIPDCQEGTMPLLSGGDNQIFDKCGNVEEPDSSPIIENERRLFYVGLTRARKAVYISFSSSPHLGNQLSSQTKTPSPFIEETGLDQVKELFTLYQTLTPEDDENLQQYYQKLIEFGGNKRILSNLITDYLPKKDIVLPIEVLDIISKIPDIDSDVIQPVEKPQQKKKWYDDD